MQNILQCIHNEKHPQRRVPLQVYTTQQNQYGFKLSTNMWKETYRDIQLYPIRVSKTFQAVRREANTLHHRASLRSFRFYPGLGALVGHFSFGNLMILPFYFIFMKWSPSDLSRSCKFFSRKNDLHEALMLDLFKSYGKQALANL